MMILKQLAYSLLHRGIVNSEKRYKNCHHKCLDGKKDNTRNMMDFW